MKPSVRSFLAVDIGNTSCQFGLFVNGTLKQTASVLTLDVLAKKKLEKKIRALSQPESIVLCSVVPRATTILKRSLHHFYGMRPQVIGQEIRIPIRNLYKNPKQVGSDRLVNAFFAFWCFHKPCIVVDFGTAVTFDVVSKRGAYLGGVIAPGIEITLEALYQKTALLPHVRFKAPRALLGKDTASSILSGCGFGIGYLCDGVVLALKKRYFPSARVIGTGGYARLMTRYTRTLHHVDPHLTLKGIYLVSCQADKANLSR